MKNHYHTLGLSRDATADEVKVAYRKLATKFHPDKNDGDIFFEERFKDILEAYETLSNPQKKDGYDKSYDDFFDKKQPYQQEIEEEVSSTGCASLMSRFLIILIIITFIIIMFCR